MSLFLGREWGCHGNRLVGGVDAGAGTQFLCLNVTSSLIIQRLVEATGERRRRKRRSHVSASCAWVDGWGHLLVFLGVVTAEKKDGVRGGHNATGPNQSVKRFRCRVVTDGKAGHISSQH